MIFLPNNGVVCQGGASNPLWNGLQAYYTADNTPNDALGTYNGTLVNGTTYGTGIINQGFSFDGVNDYVSLPTDYFRPTSSFSLSLWFNTNVSPTTQTLYVQCNSSGYDGFRVFISTGSVGFLIYNTSTLIGNLNTAGNLFGTSTYNNVVCINDYSSGMYIYLNGTLVGSNTTKVVLPLTTSTTINRIGQNYNGTSPVNGIIDEIGMWNRVLTSTEVTELYNAGAGKQYPN